MSGGFSNVSQPFGFTGYQNDDISGMYFAQARYYSSNLGRFGAQDVVRDVIPSDERLRFYTSIQDSIDFLTRFYIAIGVLPMSEGGSAYE